jgi:spore coat polysaccharide biosynthesis predicted glycosyltransferase SpsG
LKRHFPVTEIKHDWMTEPVQFIQVDDKSRLIKNNKKYLVGFIYNLLENNWISLGEKKIRRTIKKYLDGIK